MIVNKELLILWEVWERKYSLKLLWSDTNGGEELLSPNQKIPQWKLQNKDSFYSKFPTNFVMD